MGCSSGAVPYGSIVASIFIYCGIGVFCGSSLTALSYTEEMLDESKIDADAVIYALRITIYALTPFMVLVALMYSLFGYAATKQSKAQVYDDRQICCGGLACVSVTLYLAYLLLVVWLTIFGASSLPMVFTYMVSQSNYTDTGCLDLRLYGFVNQEDSVDTTVCEMNLHIFQSAAGDAFVMYVLQLCGCFLVVIGMIHFMMCLSANWAHLKDGLKRRDYESRRREEEAELQEMGTVSSLHRGPRAKVYDTSMGQQAAYNPNLPPIGGYGEMQMQQQQQPPPLHHHHRHPSQPTVSTERLVNDYY
jgi:hypothetical protein